MTTEAKKDYLDVVFINVYLWDKGTVHGTYSGIGYGDLHAANKSATDERLFCVKATWLNGEPIKMELAS